MINFFLNEREGLTSQKRKLIDKKFIYRRKYNPFHLDCEYSKRKLCYCKKNPISHLTEGQKAELWRNSYMKPFEFFNRNQTPNLTDQQKVPNADVAVNGNHQFQQDNIQRKNKILENEAGRQFKASIEKIRALGKQQLVSFIREHSKKYRKDFIDEPDAAAQIAGQF